MQYVLLKYVVANSFISSGKLEFQNRAIASPEALKWLFALFEIFRISYASNISIEYFGRFVYLLLQLEFFFSKNLCKSSHYVHTLSFIHSIKPSLTSQTLKKTKSVWFFTEWMLQIYQVP